MLQMTPMLSRFSRNRLQMAMRSGLLLTIKRELERHTPAVDLLVAHAVAVAVDPAGFVEQVFRLVEILPERLGRILGKHPGARVDRCRGIASYRP